MRQRDFIRAGGGTAPGAGRAGTGNVRRHPFVTGIGARVASHVRERPRTLGVGRRCGMLSLSRAMVALVALSALQVWNLGFRKVDVMLPGKGNSNSHGPPYHHEDKVESGQ